MKNIVITILFSASASSVNAIQSNQYLQSIQKYKLEPAYIELEQGYIANEYEADQ